MANSDLKKNVKDTYEHLVMIIVNYVLGGIMNLLRNAKVKNKLFFMASIAFNFS